jgi:hypothetical protein
MFSLTSTFGSSLHLSLGAAALVLACSSSNGSDNPAQGGNGPTGGSGATVTSGGSATTTGGATANTSGGIATASGGMTSTGGAATTTGGTTSTGGAATATGGSATSTGGAASGGATNTGGGTATSTGGSSAGGTTSTGGAASGGATTGGKASTGGTASTGGSSGAAGAGTAGTTNTWTGFGNDTKGGSGGTVLRVTTLAATGPGSLTEALAKTGPRIIVFEVGGIIDLNRARITISQPFVTLAGQTAPSPGITLIRGGMVVNTHDVRISHLRFRMGDAGDTASTGFEPDVTTDGGEAHDIVFDHCSVAWGVDENLSISGPRFDGTEATSRRVTLSNNIIAEGLYDSVHEKGIHSMGTLIHDYCTDIAVVGNFYAHNNERNPWFKGFAKGVIVNNVVYNPGKWAMRLGAVLSEWTESGITPQPPAVSVVGNYMRYGKNTPANTPLIGSNSSGTAYSEDNLSFDAAGKAATIVGPSVTALTQKPSWPTGLVARPAAQVSDWVLAHAGARPKDRDAVDQRLVTEFKNGTGGFVNSQADVGGYPTATPTTRALTVPATNIDAWLASMAAELE